MAIDISAVNALVIDPESYGVHSHYELLQLGQERYEGTVTVVGLAS